MKRVDIAIDYYSLSQKNRKDSKRNDPASIVNAIHPKSVTKETANHSHEKNVTNQYYSLQKDSTLLRYLKRNSDSDLKRRMKTGSENDFQIHWSCSQTGYSFSDSYLESRMVVGYFQFPENTGSSP